MYDWNGNGNRNDTTDNFIEYQIYKDCTSNNSTPRNSTNTNTSGSGFWIVLIIACIVSAFSEGLGVLILIGYGLLKIMGM